MEIVEERKREQKGEVKRIGKVAKEQGRANRDEDMDFFSTYYKEKCLGVKYLAFKKQVNHPKLIIEMLQKEDKASTIR